MAEVVKDERLVDPRGAKRLLELGLHRPLRPSGGARPREYTICRRWSTGSIPLRLETHHDAIERLRDRHEALSSTLGRREVDHPRREVDLCPGELEQFPLPHAGIEGGEEGCPEFRRTDGEVVSRAPGVLASTRGGVFVLACLLLFAGVHRVDVELGRQNRLFFRKELPRNAQYRVR